MMVFVTGGNGFIGSVVVRTLLQEGHSVRCLLRATSKTDRIDGFSYERADGDVRDAGAVQKGMSGCDAVIHLASLSAWNDIDSPLMDEVVEGGTRNVIDAARAMGGTVTGSTQLKKVARAVPRVVFVSSVLAINGSDEPQPFDESAAFALDASRLSYSRSKLKAEAMCLEANKAGVPVVIVNPAEVYGPNDTAFITACNLIDFAKSSPVLVCKGGTSVAYVDDVALGVVRAMEKGRPGERYILGGENLSIQELASLCLEILGQKKSILKFPNGLIKGLTAVATTLHVPLPYNPHVIPYATKYWYMNATKAQRELGVNFRSARECLAPTLAWLQQAGHIKGPVQKPAQSNPMS